MTGRDPKFVWREVIGTSMVNGSDYVFVTLICGHRVVLHLGVPGCRKSYDLILSKLSEMGPACTKIQCYLCPQMAACIE